MQLESGEKGWVKVTDWNSFQTGNFTQLCGSCLSFWWPVTILKLRAQSAMLIRSFFFFRKQKDLAPTGYKLNNYKKENNLSQEERKKKMDKKRILQSVVSSYANAFCLLNSKLTCIILENAGTRFRTVFFYRYWMHLDVRLTARIQVQWCKYIISEDITKGNGLSNWSQTSK